MPFKRLLALLAGVACLAASDAPLAGMWGADNALLALDAQGGRLQFGCRIAHFGPVHVDADGAFSLLAQVETLSLLPPDDAETEAPPEAGTLSGHMAGGDLDLTLAIDGQPPRRLQLKLGQRGKLGRCL